MTVPTSIPNDPASAAPGGDGASQATSRAAEIGQRAAAAIDDRRETLARGIDSAAASLHAKADSLPGGEKVAGAAHTAAAAMENAAGYVRDQDLQAMLSDVQQVVKKHPGAILLIATAVGFLLGRAISRN
jgi:ElaB/YqjD/DUF883 family membrane-anchored ribosome-binding protein